MVEVQVISTPELGDRSYVVHDAEHAVVVDPQRDVDRVEAALDRLGLTCDMVLETHVHNDYVSGGAQLASRTGAAYMVPDGAQLAVEHRQVADGDELRAGRLRVRVLGSPGHTDEHVSYLVDDGEGPPAVFSGGSLLYGSVGRTDLVDPARTEELTRRQYRSAQRLAGLVADDAPLYPTHGFGSFCSSGAATGGESSTIGAERHRNDALTAASEDAFVNALIAGLTDYPAYYAHMAPINRRGAGPIDLSEPEPADGERLRQRIIAGEWVVDLRSRTAFAADHVAGTVSVGLGPHFATYLGWLFPWGTPLTLIGEDRAQVRAAQLQLVRIGIDRPAAAASGEPEDLAGGEPRRSYPTATFAELAACVDAVVLDVRRADERVKGRLPGSTHIPLHELVDRMDEVPDGRVWVHCAGGYRASIAASLIDRAGRDVVLVDDDFDNALGITTR
ncbi:MAG: MBL fold metallo-hydrolase [Acidimicrobiales bacterium]